MNKILFHRIIIGVLILLNLFLVAKIILPGDRGHHRMGDRAAGGPKMMIAKKLNFDSAQMQKFEVMVENHHSTVRALDKEMRLLKHSLLRELDQQEESKRDSTYQEIGELQAQVERAHIQHFIAVKSLCREDQLEDFEKLNRRLVEMFSKGRERRGRH